MVSVLLRLIVGTIIPITTDPMIPDPRTITFTITDGTKKRQDTIIISHITSNALTFAFFVIPLLARNSLMYGPVIRLFINFVYSFSELLTYNPAVSKRNGVAGSPGINIPATPRHKETVPNNMNKNFIV